MMGTCACQEELRLKIDNFTSRYAYMLKFVYYQNKVVYVGFLIWGGRQSDIMKRTTKLENTTKQCIGRLLG